MIHCRGNLLFLGTARPAQVAWPEQIPWCCQDWPWSRRLRPAVSCQKGRSSHTAQMRAQTTLTAVLLQFDIQLQQHPTLAPSQAKSQLTVQVDGSLPAESSPGNFGQLPLQVQVHQLGSFCRWQSWPWGHNSSGCWRWTLAWHT